MIWERCIDLLDAIALADDLGGQDKLSEPSKILVRQAAAMTVQVEGLQSKICSSWHLI